MISPGAQIDIGSLGNRPFARTDMVLRLMARDGAVQLVVRDASTRRFAGLSLRSATRPTWLLPGVPDEAVIDLFALSPDGSRLLFGDPAVGRYRLSLHALATGVGVTLPPSPGDDANAAAFAPDGDRIAVLALDDDRATVTVLDVDGGRPRPLWATEGGTSAETVVSWSPDGGFLAVTYIDPEDADHTVVMDDAGTVVADIPQTAIAAGSRLGWTGDHDLLLDYEFWENDDVSPPLVLADAATGARREVPQRDYSGVLGALDGRVLRFVKGGRVVSTALDGSDPQPVFDVGPDYEITFFDAIPGALG